MNIRQQTCQVFDFINGWQNVFVVDSTESAQNLSQNLKNTGSAAQQL